MKVTIEEVKNHFKQLGNYKTNDVSTYAKDLIKKKDDVSELKDYVLSFGTAHRIYFQVSLKQLNTLEQQLDFLEENIELLQDWWHTDQLLQFLKKPCDFKVIFERCKKYVLSPLTFERRLGYVLFLTGGQKNPANFDAIISLYKDDNEYYVQMAEAWLLADLCIYNPAKTVEFIKNCHLKYEILGKAIQKIQDSFRIDVDTKKACRDLRESVRYN